MDLNKLNATITERVELAPGIIILKVAPMEGNVAEFKAGQYATLGVLSGQPRHSDANPDKSTFKPDGWDKVIVRRPYSISSSPNEKGFVELYITMVTSGAVTPKIFTLKVGDQVFLSEKFGGLFTLDDVSSSNDLILACTGTGLAPFMSMIRTHTEWGNEDKKITLFHGARHSCELGFKSELENLANERKNFAYIPIVSRPSEKSSGWDGETGHIQDSWADNRIKEVLGYTPDPEKTSILLCGNPDMIKDAVPVLEGNGFIEHKRKTPGNIHSEKYW